ncbi:uncharacterized protein LOC127290633 [Leptopilina boulardi]|uniref:uncharacterized protein LOC127290633 n=1 Tax=Leptopilina boulardi TaxID=63433 RepID=UPI0021F535FE|nr:uncharacterized protein LOC127290633 [Leptopilina boulardi]XP_051175289.1 uncharacterized protein LOC127290633 [Leptopilina boulardi]
MMNDTSVFVQHSPNFQFLSVCHYITTLGVIFYNKGLIRLNERNQTVPVLNTYFKYLNNSNNVIETKLQLLQTILKGNDLYGGDENETLDTKYVDETYQYIINNALFSHYGNINDYLAKIINKADNTSYSTLMKTIKQEFFNNYTSIDYCSKTNKSPKLNFLSAKTIFFEYILPIFPEPENKDMNIMEVDYLYAMAGLKIVKSILAETLNASFGDLISITREFDLQEDYGNETYQIMLAAFSTPALFFYASKEKETFREKYQTLFNAEFWNEVYENLFSNINLEMNKIKNHYFENNLYYKFEKEMKELKNRRLLATTILEKHCTFSTFKNLLSESVTNYMSYYHFLVKLTLPSGCSLENLPELQVVYEKQFENVRKTKYEIEKIAIRKVLNDSKLKEKLDSKSIVSDAKAKDYPTSMGIPPMARKINPNVYLLFAVKEEGKTDFYAIIDNDNVLSLLVRSDNKQEFGNVIANDSYTEMEINIIANDMKFAHEDSEAFIERIAEIKTRQFVNRLMDDYKNETTKEKVFNFLKILVPFYNCIESVKADSKIGAAISCPSDALILLPGVSLATKYATKISDNFVIGSGQKYLIRSTFASTASASRLTSLYQVSKVLARSVSQEILTKHLLKDMSISFLQVVDPGFQLTFHLSKFGYKSLHKTYNFMIQKIATTAINKNLKLILTTMLKKLNTKMKLSTTFNGLIPKVLREEKNYKLVQYYYPGGENFFGPTCISSFGNTAELRTIEGSSPQVPVLPVKDNMNKISYRKYNPATNEISNIKLEMGENDLLRSNLPYLEDTKIIPYKVNLKTQQVKGGLPTNDIPLTSKGFDQLLSPDTLPNVDISGMDRKELLRRLMPYLNLDGDTKIIKDYQVYHNTIEWNKTPNNPGTSREIVPSGNTLDTSRPAEELVLSNPLSKVMYGEQKYREMLLSLEDLKPEKWVDLYKNKDKLITLQKNLERIRWNQDIEKCEMPKELWFKQTLDKPLIVDTLKAMKGEDFYFNDITLLTDIRPSEINIVNEKSNSITEVRYHMTIDSQYGIVDLAAFDKSWKNQFVVYPELTFSVVNAEFKNGRDFLLLELKQKPILQLDWQIYKIKYNYLLDTKEISTFTRSVDIENAASLISLNTPRHRLTEMEEMLKGYILRIDPIETRVPTYEMLAKEINTGITPSKIFNEWKIKNHIFIDDVLFKKSLYQIENLEDAKKTINYIFDGIHLQNIEAVFESYKLFPIRQNMRFEDYYVLYSHFANTLPPTAYAQRKFLASLYRLALRQCDDKFTTIPKTLYRAVELSREELSQLLFSEYYLRRFKMNHKAFYSNAQNAVKNTPRTSDSKIVVLYKLEIQNPSGIVHIDPYYFNVPMQMYYVPDEISFTYDWQVDKPVKESDFITLPIVYMEIIKEKRMVRLVNELNTLFSTNDKFYANLNSLKNKPAIDYRNAIEIRQPIVKGGLPSDNIPSTSRGPGKLTSQGNFRINDVFDKKKLLKVLANIDYTETLVLFENKGIAGLKDSKSNLYNVRSLVDSLSNIQIIKPYKFKLPTKLFSQTSMKSIFVSDLEKLKGKEFFFNDLTFLRDIAPIDSKISKFPFEKEVRFHITMNSQYGIVDLSEFQHTLKNQYIVYPELEFTVQNTHYINGESILQMDLVQKPIEKEKWIKIREESSKLLNNKEVEQLIRSSSIEEAADFISTRIPLHRLSDAKKMLKEYILRPGSSNIMLSYNSLAKDIFESGSIPSLYSPLKIKNNIFIDDVLFQNSLYEVKNLASAERTINRIFRHVHIQDVAPVFDAFKSTIGIQNNIRFEDYFVIYSHFSGKLKGDKHWKTRLDVAFKRLALRQIVTGHFFKKPFPLYQAHLVSNEHYNQILGRELGKSVSFSTDNSFHRIQEDAMKYIPNTSDKKILFTQLNLNSMAGIAYIDRSFKFPTNRRYYIPQSFNLKKYGIIKKTIDGENVDFILLKDDSYLDEYRMVKLVNDLNKLYSSDLMFHFNDI